MSSVIWSLQSLLRSVPPWAAVAIVVFLIAAILWLTWFKRRHLDP